MYGVTVAMVKNMRVSGSQWQSHWSVVMQLLLLTLLHVVMGTSEQSQHTYL